MAAVTFKGNPVTLEGTEAKIGQTAPDFTAVDNGLQPVKFSDFKGNIVIINAVPSLDTGICDSQSKRFNEEAGKLKAKIITISLDTPFAQKRWCGAQDAVNMAVLSDARDREFAMKYGLYMKELGLIARSIFVVGKDGKIAYAQIVPEMASHPNYDEALEAAKKAGA